MAGCERVTADIEVADDKGYTPLMTAAYFGHELLVLRLLDRGANPIRKTYAGV
jgi:ankyrin repeat protein